MKQRIEWIDMAKGYGIIFLIVGHLGIRGFATSWIYSFHMPLFFFLSGCVFRGNQPFSVFLKHKLRTMVLPYFTLSLLVLPSYMMSVYNDITIGDVFSELIKIIIQQRAHVFWFLACLFVIEIIFWLLNNKLSEKQCAVSVLVMTSLGLLYTKSGGISLPWNIDIAFIAISFFYFGYLFRSKGLEMKYDQWANVTWKKLLCFATLGAVNILTCYLCIRINGSCLEMNSGTYGFIPFVLIAAYSGIFAVVVFAKLFVVKPLCYVGKNSLVYFTLQSQIGIPLGGLILKRLGICYDSGWHIVQKAGYIGVYLIFTLAVLTMINIILTKTKLKILIGK